MKNPPNKRKIRAQTYKAISCGELKRAPCEVCGKEKVDAHHPDYLSHLNVMWLCRKHHWEWLKENGFVEGSGDDFVNIFVTRGTRQKLKIKCAEQELTYDQLVSKLLR